MSVTTPEELLRNKKLQIDEQIHTLGNRISIPLESWGVSI